MYRLLRQSLCSAVLGMALFTLASRHGASAQAYPVRLRFANADVSDVLQAISLKTRANIVYPAQLKRPISLNVAANNVEEALNYVTAAANLVWRKLGSTYVIAPAESLRGMVEQFGEHTAIPLSGLPTPEAVSILSSALPYITVRPAGNEILLIGAPEDIAQARSIVAQQESLRRADPQEREVVSLDYAGASGLAAMLKSLFPSLKVEAAGVPDRPGGSIGLYGPAGDIRSARDIIRTVDSPGGMRIPERVYRVYHIKHSSAPLLRDFMQKAAPSVTVNIGPEAYSPPMPGFRPLSGATLGTTTSGGIGGGLGGGIGGGTGGGGLSGGSGGSSFGGNNFGVNTPQTPPKEGDRAKLLVLSGTAQELDSAFKLLDDVDIPPKQVVVEVKVVDTSPERAENLGVAWNWTRFGFYESPAGTGVNTSNTNSAGDFTQFNTRPLGFGAFSRVPFSFSAVLSAMISRKEAKLLANPRMTVTDNDDANIFVGDTVRSQIIAQGGINGTTIQIAEFPVGIILLVRPRISDDGTITMRVHPVVSTITSVDATSGLPQTSAREAETTVMVKDGETFAIGGLIRDEMSKTVQEVPFLSKLPLVGELFRNRTVNHRHSDVLVFITPRIVK